MKVRENSWFFRLFLTKKLQRNFMVGAPVDVCSVARSFITYTSLYITLLVAIICLAACLVLLLYGFATGTTKELNPLVYLTGRSEALIIFLVAFYFIVKYLIHLVVILLERPVEILGDKLDTYFSNRSKKVKEPGLLSTYLKARKEKICTLVEFERES